MNLGALYTKHVDKANEEACTCGVQVGFNISREKSVLDEAGTVVKHSLALMKIQYHCH